MKQRRFFPRTCVAAMIAAVMVCAAVFAALPACNVWADRATTPVSSLKVNGTDIGEFKIVYPTTAAETALRPTVKNADKFALGKEAARELKEMMQAVLGEELATEAAEDTSSASSKTILLTFDPAMQEDEFKVTVAGDTITIQGGTAHGIWYGVYDFLEDALGYRFFTKDIVVSDVSFVNQDGADVDMDGAAVNLKDRTWSEKSPFTYRSISGKDFGDLANVSGPDEVTNSFNATFDNAGIRANLATRQNGMDDNKWGIAYPQWGSGKGTVMSHAHAFTNLLSGTGFRGADPQKQPCFADEAEFQKVVEEVLWLIEWETDWSADPTGAKRGFPLEHTIGENIHQISVGLNDNADYCDCEGCQAKIAEMGNLTDVYIDYVNRVAAEVEKKFGKGIQVMALAYNVTAEPPMNVVPAENVDILYCSVGCNNHTLEEVAEDPSICTGAAYYVDQNRSSATNLKYLQGWAEITENIYVWEYMDAFFGYIAQAPFYTYIRQQFRALAELGVKGIYAETSESTKNARYSFEDLRDYLMGRLMWDPDMSDEEFEKMTKEFLAVVYGGSADFEATEDLYAYLLAWDKGGRNDHCWMNNFSSVKAENDLEYYAENGDAMLAMLDRVRAKVTDADAINRVEKLQAVCGFLTMSGQYTERYTNGDEASKQAYIDDYNELKSLAENAGIVQLCNSVWGINGNPLYTSSTGVVLDYCPLNWLRGMDSSFMDIVPIYYRAEYRMNDGTDAVYTTQKIPNYYTLAPQENPVRPGYIFAGWKYQNEAGEETAFTFGFYGTKISAENSKDGVFTLYADWTPCEDHTYNDGEITKAPTYKEEGEKTFTCTKCGATKTEAVEKLVCTDHVWDEGVVSKEPTVTEEGKKVYTCTQCGETKEEILAKTEEKPGTDKPGTDKPATPDTGDTNVLWVYVSLMLAAACAAVLTQSKRRNKAN